MTQAERGRPRGRRRCQGRGSLGLVWRLPLFTKHRARPCWEVGVRGAQAQPLCVWGAPPGLQRHTRVHAHTHTHTHVCARTHTHRDARTHMCAQAHAHSHKHTHMRVHTHAHARIRYNWCTCWKKWEKEETQPDTSLVHCDHRKQLSWEGCKRKTQMPAKESKKARTGLWGCRYYGFLFWFQRKVEKSMFHLGRPVKPIKCCESVSYSIMSDSLRPHRL